MIKCATLNFNIGPIVYRTHLYVILTIEMGENDSDDLFIQSHNSEIDHPIQVRWARVMKSNIKMKLEEWKKCRKKKYL